eukprot:TRINITY_DN4705_c0_g1_i1.p1 TRINITY_DN4705_c0_g1~~TRINITY_DN4705_c0_g1_i1.p1  ORF type:complete len:346 (-),score=67.49 TRINITY_DN4705_c0_g1_i1:289-1326(-)
MSTPESPAVERVKRGSVLGGGAFGSAMAELIASNNTPVSIYARDPKTVESINTDHTNPSFLGDSKLSTLITATMSIAECVKDTDILMICIPTPFLRDFVVKNRDLIPTGVPIVCCSKGIENNTLLTPFEILIEELPGKYHNQIAALSGPSFAKEVVQHKPTNVTIASQNQVIALKIQRLLSNRWFRVYTSNDMIGAELCGALKNVIAIACGASDGFGFGMDARAALITRGLAEITRLVVRKGGSQQTMLGLCGVGDLVLTCTGSLSRNWTVGNRMAKGETMEEIKKTMKMVAEGVNTAYSVHQMSSELGVDMPICEQVYRVIFEGISMGEALANLQNRPLRSEQD